MSGDGLIGKKLGDYTIQTLLGQGGMARVYKGYDDTLQRYAAVKVVEPRLLAGQDENEYRERFLREARAIARINHPSVVSVFQFGELDNLYYMAMGFVEGDDLREIIKEYSRQKKYISNQKILRIVQDIAEALDYSHKNGVIHRDVKPSNIMVTSDGQAVLTDFGLALSAHEGTLGNTFGSVHYIAPEQAISSANAVPQSDLYSLGVVLYEMLTGKVPFEDASAMSVALKHISDPPPRPSLFNPRITENVETVLMKALDKDPRKRYATGEEFAKALEASFSADVVEDTDDLERDKSNAVAPDANRLRKADNQNIASRPPSHSTRPSSLLRPIKGASVTEDDPTARDIPNTSQILEKRPSTTSRKSPVQSKRRRSSIGVMFLAIVLLASALGAFALILGNTTRPPVDDEDATLPTRVALNHNDEPTSEVEGMTPSRRNDGEPSLTPTNDKGEAVVTPRIDALNMEEPQLMLYYDKRMIVLYNRASQNNETLNVSNILFSRLSDETQFESNEWLRVTPSSTRLSQMRKVDCFQVIDQPFSILPLPDFCQIRQGYIRTPRSFWLSDMADDAFEVWRDDQLLATCPTIAPEDEEPFYCFIDLNS